MAAALEFLIDKDIPDGIIWDITTTLSNIDPDEWTVSIYYHIWNKPTEVGRYPNENPKT